MYRDALGHGIYDLWQRKNPNIEMPEPMKRYNPYTVTPSTLTLREYGKMVTAWIHYWRVADNHGQKRHIDLPENLRGKNDLLLHEVAYMEPHTYCKPAIMWLAVHGNDEDMPEYIKPNCPYKNGVDENGDI